MKTIRSITAILLTAAFAFCAFPAFAVSGGGEPERTLHHGNTLLDTDPEGGYEGDYVVIYNPSADPSSAFHTGSMEGLIETSAGEGSDRTLNDPLPYIIDVDSELAESSEPVPEEELVRTRADYPVGAVHSFKISHYTPTGSAVDLDFEVLALGEHCRVWSVLDEEYHPLTEYDPQNTFAATIADQFDSKYELMSVSYGEMGDYDLNGDGRVNILCYNIFDSWAPDIGSSYTAGYFWSGDFSSSTNGLPLIHIDTYPGIAYTDTQGVQQIHLSKCYSTLVHEYQHLLNYANTPSHRMHSWLNEALSGSAEELCYPGNALISRLRSWTDDTDVMSARGEYQYNSSFTLHSGGTLAYWQNGEANVLVRYAEVLFFSQYLYTKYGDSSVYKAIIENCTANTVAGALNAILAATGWSCEELWSGFFISMVANDPEAGYGFRLNEGYDPSTHYGIENPYVKLAPIVCTDTEDKAIYGGGFITVKPVGGVYYPPETADEGLCYAGVSFVESSLSGLSLSPSGLELATGETVHIDLVTDPLNCTSFTAEWTSSDPDIVLVEGDERGAELTALAEGEAEVSVSADTGENVFTAELGVTVFAGRVEVRYVPTDSIETDGEYMIVRVSDGEGFALLNGLPGSEGGYLCTWEMDHPFVYGARTVFDEEGRITGVTDADGGPMDPSYAVWSFISNFSGYFIRSLRGEYDLFTEASGSGGLYISASGNFSNCNKWNWDAETGLLSHAVSGGSCYLTYAPSAFGYENLFYAPTEAGEDSVIKLYKRVETVVREYTVTFEDADGTVIAVLRVDEGEAAEAPEAPVLPGYVFLGWDADLSCVTSNMTVHAVRALRGDADGDGELASYDALIILRAALGLIETDPVLAAVADADMNGEIDSYDALHVLRLALGLIAG